MKRHVKSGRSLSNSSPIKNTLLYALFAGLFIACTSKEPHRDQSVTDQHQQKPISTPVGFSNRIIFTENIGWGYQIFENGKLIIDQKNVPAVQGNTGFKTKEDAEKVCQFVTRKLEQKEFPPSVSVDELDSLLMK